MTFKTEKEIVDLTHALNLICNEVVAYAMGGEKTKKRSKRTVQRRLTMEDVEPQIERIKEYYREFPIKELSDAFFEIVGEKR